MCVKYGFLPRLGAAAMKALRTNSGTKGPEEQEMTCPATCGGGAGRESSLPQQLKGSRARAREFR